MFSSRKSIAITDHLIGEGGSQDSSIVSIVTGLWALRSEVETILPYFVPFVSRRAEAV